jgi:hypothetical protein
VNKPFVRCLPTLVMAAALPLAALASDHDATAKQAATASAHAGMAMGASDLKTTRMHLHHVVNCLVGPGGKGFDAAEANPCKGMGQGAIVDAKGDAAAEARLHQALKDAKQGLKAPTLASAQADAKQAMTALQQSK